LTFEKSEYGSGFGDSLPTTEELAKEIDTVKRMAEQKKKDDE
jgi:hypothetical protein